MRSFVRIIIMLLSLGIFQSCDFEQLPSDRIPMESAWQTVNDAMNFRTGIYGEFQQVSGGPCVYLPDYQADVYNVTLTFGNRGGEFQRWDFTSTQEHIQHIWQQNYRVINNCNNIIQNIGRIVPENDQEKVTLDGIKGEAHIMRAICYHALALRFARDYEPETAKQTLGLPLVTEVDPTGKPARSSLEATYQLIKSDIQEARSLMDSLDDATPNSIYFTMDVVDLFESRVDLYMHNYYKAAVRATQVAVKYISIMNVTQFVDMWKNDEGGEIIYRVYCSKDERNDYCSYSCFLINNGMSYQPDVVPSQWVLDLYEDTDIRKLVYFIKGPIQSNYEIVDNIYLLAKYPGNPSFDTDASYGYNRFYNMPKLFRCAEAVLIASEACFKFQDEENALYYLNFLRQYRGASELHSSGEALFNDIKNEWVREFIGEGRRLDDLKRWHDGMWRRDPQDKSILVVEPANLYHELSVTADDPRWVWEIPSNDLITNPNLEPNWK